MSGSSTALFVLVCSPTEKTPRREQQNGTHKRNQRPSCVCLGNHRNGFRPTCCCELCMRQKREDNGSRY
jgi:hypothetical protein